MATVNTYDPKAVVLTVMGIPFSGWAEDSFIEVERNENAYNTVVGADGEVARARSNNKSGTLRVRLLQTSPTNALLAAMHKLDEAEGLGHGPMVLKSNAEVAFSADCWIEKVATIDLGAEITEREWIFALSSVEIYPAGA